MNATLQENWQVISAHDIFIIMMDLMTQIKWNYKLQLFVCGRTHVPTCPKQVHFMML